MFRIICLAVCGWLSVEVQGVKRSAAPQWLSYNALERLYPRTLYLRGFAQASLSEGEKAADLLQRLVILARKELLESVQVAIKNTTTALVSEQNGRISDNFSVAAETKSVFNISNIIIEKYWDKQEKTAYVLAYADKQKLTAVYRRQLHQTTIEQLLETAKKDRDAGFYRTALGALANGMQLWLRDKPVLQLLQILGNTTTGMHYEELYRMLAEGIRQGIHKQKYYFSSPVSQPLAAVFQEPLAQPLVVYVQYSEGGAAQLPLQWLYEDGRRACSDMWSDTQGVARCVLSNVLSPRKTQTIRAQLDIQTYLNLEEAPSDTLLYFFKELLAPPLTFNLQLSPTRIYMMRQEGGADFLADKLSAWFIDKGFELVPSSDQAQLVVRWTTDISRRKDQPPIYFAYVSGSVSIEKSGRILFKNTYKPMRGAGVDMEAAKMKSLERLVQGIQSDIARFLHQE